MSVNARKETIIHAILKIQKSRKPLDRKTVAAWNPRLVWAACDYFGNWGNAITAAGLVYKDIRLHSRGEKRTKENIIQAIQDRSRQSQSITSWIVQKEDQPLYGAARRYFGSWGDAVNASGFCYDEIALQIPFRWNKNIILKKIKKRIRGKKSLQGNAVCREQLDLYNAARRYFGKGGWRKALSLCGFDYAMIKKSKWSKRSILRDIRKLHSQKISLRCFDIQQNGYGALLAAAVQLFGNWGNAITAAGFNYDAIRWGTQWNPESVIEEIQRLEKRSIRLSAKVMRKRHPSLYSGGQRYYGCWSKAVHAAGIDYMRHCMIWSSKAWLRTLKTEDIKNITMRLAEMNERRKMSERSKGG